MNNSGVTVARAVLAALSRYTGAHRLYSLDLAGSPTELVVERWQGWESLSSGFEWAVDVLSTDAHLPLEPMIGRRATLWTRVADGGRLPRTGLVREATCVGSDGGLARYRLWLVPWTWLLGQGRHSRVFQDKTVLEILEAVLAGYAPLAAWQVGDEVGPFLAGDGLAAAARPRSYCVQYRETDADFVARLLAEEGLGWRLEDASGDEGDAGHRLVVFSDSSSGPEDPTSSGTGAVRFHRRDGTERSDTIQALGRGDSIGPGRLTVLTDDYRHQLLSASVALDGGDEGNGLEAYDFAGPYAFATQAEGARYAELMAQAAEARRHEWIGQGTVRSFRAGAWFRMSGSPGTRGSMDLPSGHELLLVSVQHFGINNLPDVVREAAALLECPSLPPMQVFEDAGVDQRSIAALEDAAASVGYANTFTAIPRQLPWRHVLADGTGLRLNPRPTAPGYQTAIVVGGEGSSELHADALGRVRVRFHFQDATDTSQDTCWLRVSQRYAGPGVGSQFLPRVGQEVLVGFLEGDIDRPIVVGSLYNGQGEGGIAPTPGGKEAPAAPDGLFAEASDHRPSAQGNLVGGNAPAWHGMSPDAEGHRNAAALSGFKSREFGGEGHNRLVFDDTDGELRLQLATTHGCSELNLGHLIHQADNYRGSFRGEGFELRTDQWGAIRGERGLWISAWGADADDPAGEQVAANALLRQVATLAENFSRVAGTHLTVELAAHLGVEKPGQSALADDSPVLKTLDASARTTVDGTAFEAAVAQAPDRSLAAAEGRVPHSADALLGLGAPAGMGLVAGQSLHWSTGETLTLASGAASNAAVAGNMRLHTGQAIGWLANAVDPALPPLPPAGRPDALSLVTAQGELRLEAQSDQLKLQSKETLKIISANAQVELAAGKALHLATSGGASITIEGGNISVACPGEIRVHAQKKSFVGPTQLSREMNSWPEARFDDCFQVLLADGTPAGHHHYRIRRSDGAVINGLTDAEGMVPKQRGFALEECVLEVSGPARELP